MTPEDLQFTSEQTSSIMTLMGEVNFFTLKFAVTGDDDGPDFEYSVAGEFRGNDGPEMAQMWNKASDIIAYYEENNFTVADLEQALNPVIDRLCAEDFKWQAKSKLAFLFEGARIDFDYHKGKQRLLIMDIESKTPGKSHVLAVFDDPEDVEIVCNALDDLIDNAFAKRLFFEEHHDNKAPH